jgi:hypothetical protein
MWLRIGPMADRHEVAHCRGTFASCLVAYAIPRPSAPAPAIRVSQRLTELFARRAWGCPGDSGASLLRNLARSARASTSCCAPHATNAATRPTGPPLSQRPKKVFDLHSLP